ncbi:MAG: glycoside hydrolase family 15 protein [Candidatus Woesearchaeota archaeon]
MRRQVSTLLEQSRKVIKDCTLSNGAIVAANSTKSYFPRGAKNYRFVWLRDASYTLLAADLLGLKINSRFLSWCSKVKTEQGLFYRYYLPDGKIAGEAIQPDQTAMLLIAMSKIKETRHQRLLERSADGICGSWSKDHFNLVVQDLWEERYCFPDLKENFSYTLASCYQGLCCANSLSPHQRWVKTAEQMKKLLLAKNKNYFPRTFGKIGDDRVDASLLGLTWPFEIVSSTDKRMINTVRLMEQQLVRKGGVPRYEHDEYDGWMYKNMNRKKGAGYWPLLNFWMSIYFSKAGNKKKALQYYNRVLGDLTTDFIPEQIFDNKIQISVSPLCWSHTMFVLASKELGFF